MSLADACENRINPHKEVEMKVILRVILLFVGALLMLSLTFPAKQCFARACCIYEDGTCENQTALHCKNLPGARYLEDEVCTNPNDDAAKCVKKPEGGEG